MNVDMNARQHCIVIKELLNPRLELTSFVFKFGANVYAFSYSKNGITKHVLIDAGDQRYRNEMFPLLAANGIDPKNIERIFLTHCHPDYIGLASMLAEESGAVITVHASFKRFFN